MPQNPYRQTYTLDTNIQVPVEKEVAEILKVMCDHTKLTEGEIVNTAMRRFIATHSDYFPRSFKRKKS